MRLKNYLLIVLTLFYGSISYAQGTYDVTGTVKGATDDFPIPGVNVLKVGTTNGTATDFDGVFKLNVKKGDVLEFSSVGYASQKVTITGQKTINISLQDDSNTLDEVVVVGYGTRKKSDITGAVSTVKSKELNAFPVLNATQALQGRAAGIEVQSNNGGEPGAPIALKIRGNTSINASSSPLIVVDGFIGATMPQSGDIQTLEVLKDASSTAIYGSRGANGVILVTTKKGKKGRLNFEINSSYSVQSTANELDLLGADDFAIFQNRVRENQAQTAFANNPENPDLLNFEPYVGGGFDTDFQDLIYRAGSTTNHQFSFSGGSDKFDFYTSATYFKQEGVVINSSFERLSFLSNINAKLTDKLKVGVNLSASISDKRGISTAAAGGANGSSGTDAVIANTFRFAPDVGIFDANNPDIFSQNTVGDPIDNPFGVASERVDESDIDDFRANLYFDYEILKGLNFKTTFGITTSNTFQGVFIPSTLALSSGGNPSGFIDNQRTESLLTESYLTYNKEIGKGNLTLLGGFSYQETVREGSRTAGETSGNDRLFFGLGDSTNLTLVQNQIFSLPTEFQSYFGRFNYDYDDRFLLTGTVRADQSSVFPEGNKTAIFPSAALGWKVSNEKFLEDVDAISNLKLRVSYGQTGNAAIQPFTTQDTFVIIEAQDGVAITPEQPANPDLEWEKSSQFNVGLDLGLLSNKIVFSAEYYNIDTDDLILRNDQIADITGFQGANNILSNAGAINNKGFELSLSTRNITTDDFQWTTDLVFSVNKSEVVTLVQGQDRLFNFGVPNFYDSSDVTIFREGEAAAQFFGFDYAGVYQGGAIPDGLVVVGENPLPGDPLFFDAGGVDGDGVLTSEDRTIIGDPNPDFTYGITNNFSYKNWDLNIFFQGSQGNDIFNVTASALANGDANTTVENFNNAFSATNQDTNTPRVGNASSRELSSRFVEDGSYLRLKNIALGYNLPNDVIENLGIQSLRLTLSAQNLLTFTSYSGLDPEVNFSGGSTGNLASNTSLGFDFGNYPTIQSVTFGLNVKF